MRRAFGAIRDLSCAYTNTSDFSEGCYIILRLWHRLGVFSTQLKSSLDDPTAHAAVKEPAGEQRSEVKDEEFYTETPKQANGAHDIGS